MASVHAARLASLPWLVLAARPAHAQSSASDPPVASAAPMPTPPVTVPIARGSNALLFDTAVGFVPVANDVPLMLGLGVRLHDVHEIWARAGFMPTGDDVSYGFGVVGYRLVLRPHRWVRPIFGGLTAAIPATCTHDAAGHPSCTGTPLFIFAALGGVRIEPTPWLGFSAVLTLGTDSYPNPFGMVELGVTFVLPLA